MIARRSVLRRLAALAVLPALHPLALRMAAAADPRLAQLWRCGSSECPGYEYDPLQGDPDAGVPPGTAFEDLPEDWYCPKCGAAKAEFRRIGPPRPL